MISLAQLLAMATQELGCLDQDVAVLVELGNRSLLRRAVRPLIVPLLLAEAKSQQDAQGVRVQ